MKKRLIARLDIKKNRLIKGVHLEGLRYIGDPSVFARKYYQKGIDELVLLDCVATLHGRNTLSEIIDNITKSIFIPITIGGGINSFNEAKKLFQAGADKITVNSFACENPNLISEIALHFGTQAVTLSLQIKRDNDDFLVMTHNGREDSKKNLREWLIEAQDRGIGEILLTSIDKEGTMGGFDLDLLEYVIPFCKVPIICSGGIASQNNIKDCYSLGAQGVAIASAFHYGNLDPNDLRNNLLESKIDVRSF